MIEWIERELPNGIKHQLGMKDGKPYARIDAMPSGFFVQLWDPQRYAWTVQATPKNVGKPMPVQQPSRFATVSEAKAWVEALP